MSQLRLMRVKLGASKAQAAAGKPPTVEHSKNNKKDAQDHGSVGGGQDLVR